MERKLASIQKIASVEKIENADNIVKVTFENLGWQCVAKKDDFQVGQLCVYMEIDSVLPPKEWSKFMEPRKYRIRTIKLRKTLSQGLAMPLSILDDVMDKKKIDKLKVGDDVTKVLGVTKYEIQDRHSQGSNKTYAPTASPWPPFLQKTDEIRLQSALKVLDELKNKPFYISLKYDGTSATFARKDGKFWACSRNRGVKRNSSEIFYNQVYSKLCNSWFSRWLIPIWVIVFRLWSRYFPIPNIGNMEENPWWAMVDKYNLQERIPNGYAIQGEICGPGIQGNKLELKEKELFVFNVFDIEKRRYLSYKEFINFCNTYELKHVDVLAENPQNIELSLAGFLEFARGKYPNTKNHREGIVIRPLTETFSEELRGRLSFKVINNDFLLKYDE